MLPKSHSAELSSPLKVAPNESAAMLLDRWRRAELPLSVILSRTHELAGLDLVEVLSADQYERWQQGQRISVEELLRMYPAVTTDPDAACELVYCEFRLRLDLQETPILEEYLERFPALADRLRHKHTLEQRQSLLHGLGIAPGSAETPRSGSAWRWQQPVPPDLPDYELLKWIGAGTFGQVWLARNRHDHGFCAVKVIPKIYPVELNGVRTYREHASDHPFLVPIKHVGEFAEFFYYVMPLADDIQEGTLSATVPDRYAALTLRRHLIERGSLTIDEVLAVARHLLAALAHLHQRGVRHCDVKPDNVMRLRGTWQLGDVGLAARSTEIHGERGTPAFWPPEGPTDETADLYALGKTLYLLATGAGLERFEEFADGTLKSPGADRRAEPLRQIILRACHCLPRHRFASAAEMRRALDEQCAGRERPFRPRAAFALLLACVGLSLVLVWWRPWDQEKEIARLEAEYLRLFDQGDLVAARTVARTLVDLLSARRTQPAPLAPALAEEVRRRNDQYEQLNEQGNWHEAQRIAQEKLDLLIPALAPNHPELVGARIQLDTAQKLASSSPEDQAVYLEALKRKQLIIALSRQGRYDEAIPHERLRLEVNKRRLGPDHYETGRSHLNFAYLMASAGKEPTREWTASLEEAARILQKVLGNNQDSAIALSNLASLLDKLGLTTTAQTKHEEALAMILRVRGLNHLYTGLYYFNLGKILAAQGEHSAAEKMFQKVKVVAGLWPYWNSSVVPDTPLPLYRRLAAHYKAEGRDAEAEPLHREFVRIQSLLVGEEHIEVVAAHWRLAENLATQDKDATSERTKTLELLGRLWARDTATAFSLQGSNWLVRPLEIFLRYEDGHRRQRPGDEAAARGLADSDRGL